MKVELSCLTATGEILGSASIPVVAREAALYVDTAIVPIARSGTLVRTAVFIAEIDAHVYIEHDGHPKVTAGDNLTLKPAGGRLVGFRFA